MHTISTDDALLDDIGHGLTPARPDTLTRLLAEQHARICGTPDVSPIPFSRALVAIMAGRRAYTPIRRWRAWLSGRAAALSTRLRNRSPMR
jgi:hypothetical protein